MLMDGYIILNSIALEMYLSPYRHSDFTYSNRNKYVNALLFELSGIDLFLIKNNLYLPKISKIFDKKYRHKGFEFTNTLQEKLIILVITYTIKNFISYC